MAMWRTDFANRQRSRWTRLSRLGFDRNSAPHTAPRNLRLEPCEERVLFAIGPTLTSVIPNQGAVLNNGDVLTVAPTQLILNFTQTAQIDPATLGAITISRAGGDGIFGNPGDVVVTGGTNDSTGFVGIGDAQNQVVIRFDKNLPSDKYDIHIAGALKDLNGAAFNSGSPQDIQFTLDLGAQVASVVPQPVVRNPNGTLSASAANTIDVYFTGNTLSQASATSTTNYELIRTAGTLSNADDTVVNPTTVTYNAVANEAVLTFTAGQLSQAGSYRLRVGNNDPLPVAPVIDNAPAGDTSTLTTSFNLGNLGANNVTQGTLQSILVNGGSITNASANGLPYPGDPNDPSHRNIPIAGENHVAPGASGPSAPELDYNFKHDLGSLFNNPQVFNQITAQQEQDARDILALYAKYLGVQFVETAASGFTIATSDPRLVDPTIDPKAAAGIAGGGLAIINQAIDWGTSPYGGSWMTVAMHEIGHLLGYAHADDAPPLTIMNGGAETSQSSTTPGVPAPEPVFPGDVDIVNGQYIFRPDANDINMYKFNVVQAGTVSLETIAERMANPSLLNTVLTVFDSAGNVIARNDDYFGVDSFLKLDLQSGTYYVGVTSTGNTNYDPLVPDSGSGGTSQGAYQLHVNYQPDAVTGLVSNAGTQFDGNSDGRPGGTFNFWFQVGTNTLYVDKATPAALATGAVGTITNPYTSIALAVANASSGNVIKIVGNAQATTNSAFDYQIGIDTSNSLNKPLPDGTSLSVPKGVTVMVDNTVLANGTAGGTAVFKLNRANLSVGSMSQGVDLSGGALQVLGTPGNNVIFTSFFDPTPASLATAPAGTAKAGDWGGIVFNTDADHEAQGIFLDTLDHATIKYGGGQVVVNSTSQVFDSIHLISARPTLHYNTILYGADAAMSADPNSFADAEFQNASFTADYGRTGPDIYGNILQNNSINAMFVRIRTQAGASLDTLTVPATFADPDIVYVLSENLIITGTPTRNATSGPQVGQINGRLTINPGVVVKLGQSRIETTTGSAQLIAEGTAANPIVLTSLLDNTRGAGGTFATTNNTTQAAAPGDWGGLFFGPVTSGSLDHVILSFAGGATSIEGGSDTFNAIEIYQADVRIANSILQDNAGGGGGDRNGRQSSTSAVIFVRGAQPVIVNNIIQNNNGPAISVNVNSLNKDIVPDKGPSTGPTDLYSQFSTNYGPLVRLNKLAKNAINGMVVRGGEMTTQGVWDDTDIVHVVQAAIVTGNQQTYSGLRLQSSSTQSLIVKLDGATAGFTATGRPLDISDRIGGTVQILGQPGHPVVLTSLADDSVGAGTQPNGQPDNDTNNDGIASIPLTFPKGSGPMAVTVDTNGTDLVNAMVARALPSGVTLSNANFVGGAVAAGTFINGDGVPLQIYPKGALITTGNAQIPDSNTMPDGFTGVMNSPPDADLDALIANTGFKTTEASVLTFTVNVDPTSGIRSGQFSFQFGSEEYKNFVGTAFNDVVGAFVNGGPTTNFLHDSKGNLISINSGFFDIDNTTNKYNVEYDGLTSGLIAAFPLHSGVNTVKIAIADVSDRILDSGIFLSDLHFSTNDVGAGGVSRLPSPGAWAGITLAQYSNDTNLLEVNEFEQGFLNGKDTNNTPSSAQFLGALAPNLKSGNDSQRLGFQVNGTISQPSDADVYSFTAQAGTEVWMQLDQTTASLSTVLELVDANGGVIAGNTPALGASSMAGLALPMSQGQLGPTITDPYSINAHDAAMRAVLPGAAGSTNTYYVRVRSAPDLSNPANLTNLAGGLTAGVYTLQVRLQQQVQYPGSVVQFANINYSTNGVVVSGHPNLSPLLGETESNTVAHNSLATAQDLGNLLTTNQATVSVGGTLNSSSQVDWYKLAINYDLIQRIGGQSADRTWATMFVMNYADGLTRPDSTLSIYDASGNLLLVGRDSQVADAQPRPTLGADTQNLSGGSFGVLDPFIGSAQLPVGPTRIYYIAVSSAAQLPSVLDQTYNPVATNASVRLEPVDSVTRVVEDHLTVDNMDPTAAGKNPSGTADPAVNIFGNTANQLDAHATPLNLGNVTLYVTGPGKASPSELFTVNPSTGASITDQGGMAGSFGDLAMRNDGELYSLNLGNNDANSANYTRIDTGTAATISSASTGIATFHLVAGAVTPLNTGLQFNAESFRVPDSTAPTARQLFGIGNIGGVGQPPNLLFQLDPNSGAAVGPGLNPTLPTNVSGFQLFSGTTIVASKATNALPTPNIVDGQTFTVTSGATTKTFEFDSGPSANLNPNGGRAINPGDTFSVDGKTYEFNEGQFLNVNGGAAGLTTTDTLQVTNSANPALTTIFQFVNNASQLTDPGNVPIFFGPGASAANIANDIVAAVNGVAGFGVNAFISSLSNTRVLFTGATALSPTLANPAEITVGGSSNPAPGNVAVPYNENQSVDTIGASIVAAFNANDPAGNKAGYASGRINFLGGAGFVPAPSMTNLNTFSGVAAGNVRVPFLFSDQATDVAIEIANAINNAGFGATAQAVGIDVLLDFANGVTVSSPLGFIQGGPGGSITGLAQVGNTMYAVSSNGGFYTLNLSFNGGQLVGGNLTSLVAGGVLKPGTGLPIQFSGLTAGPPDVNGGAYKNDLFATDSSGELYALNVNGVLLSNVFAGGVKQVNSGVIGATGLAFSTLDYNLWHVTTVQPTVAGAPVSAGHGVNAAPDNSRAAVGGGTSYYFGLDTPDLNNPINTITQPGAAAYATNPTLYNTYGLPGGAIGSLTSKTFSLSGYAAQDKPTLYFNYFLDTRDVNTLKQMEDSFRVYLSPDGGATWVEVATNNHVIAGKTAELPTYVSADGGGVANYRPGDDPTQNVQEVFDNTGAWRQARIDLGKFAGSANLTMRFDFSTAGTTFAGTLPGDVNGDLHNAGRGTASGRTGVFIDDIILGFAGRGEMVTGATPVTSYFAVPQDTRKGAPTQSLTGAYQFEVRRGTEYGANVDKTTANIKLGTSFSINDRLSQSLSLQASAGNLIGNHSTFTISDGVNTASFEFTTSGAVIHAGFIPVTYSAAYSASSVANAVVAAINGQNVAKVEAANADPTQLTSNQVNLFDAQSFTGGTSFTKSSALTTEPNDPLNDTIFDAVDTGLSSASPGQFIGNGVIGDNTNLPTADVGFDVDFAKFQLNAGDTATINLTADASGANTLLRLFDAMGNVVSAVVTSIGNNRQITYTALVSGVYYLGISGHANTTYNPLIPDSGTDGQTSGNYSLSIFVGTPAATGLSETIYDNRGDTSTPRLQGYTLIQNNTINFAQVDGIKVTAGTRNANGDPVPGSPKFLPVLNSQGLVPGVAIVNNVIDNSGSVGIDLIGDAASGPLAPSLFARVVNNTIYGGSVATGTGINVTNGFAPTLMNNIVANTATAVQVDATSSSKTVLIANLYQNNTSKGVGGSELDAISLLAGDPLFVNPTNGDFYLAELSRAIDSSLNSLQDRTAMTAVTSPLGIPASPIIAPAYDELGQLRVDDTSVSSPPGLGQNVYIDRGALDRADFVAPTSALINPVPTNPSTPNTATVTSGPITSFSIQLSDVNGSGIDPSTVFQSQFTLTGPDPTNSANTITLQPTTNYLFSYDGTNGIVTFSAAAGVWTAGTYTITVNNKTADGVKDLAGNALAANNAANTTLFTINISASSLHPWQNPVNQFDVDNSGFVNVVDLAYLINALNTPGMFGKLPLPSTAPPYYDVNGDGLLSPLDVAQEIVFINNQINSQVVTSAASTQFVTTTDTTAASTTTAGPLTNSAINTALSTATPTTTTPVTLSPTSSTATHAAAAFSMAVTPSTSVAAAAPSTVNSAPAITSAAASNSTTASPTTVAASSNSSSNTSAADAHASFFAATDSIGDDPELEDTLSDLAGNPRGQLLASF